MTDFGEAFKKGLDGHKKHEETRREIDEVLNSASIEVTRIAGAPIKLGVETIDRPAREQSRAERMAQVPAPREKSTVLTARSQGLQFQALADFTFGDLGFPVTLRWADQFRMATDRAGFEAVLADLLGHSATGAKLAKLLSP